MKKWIEEIRWRCIVLACGECGQRIRLEKSLSSYITLIKEKKRKENPSGSNPN